MEYWECRYESTLKNLNSYFPALVAFIGDPYATPTEDEYKEVTLELEAIIKLAEVSK